MFKCTVTAKWYSKTWNPNWQFETLTDNAKQSKKNILGSLKLPGFYYIIFN
jgi:hypothetical protein